MKVLITGAQGQLGQDLQRVFATHHEIVPLSREHADIINFEATLAAIGDARPDVIVHTAAFTAVDECESKRELAFKTNALGTRNVAVAARKIGAKLVYISTDYVFDGCKEKPYREYDNPNPVNVYGRSKWWGEQLVKQQVGDHFIVRTAWLYGSHGKNFVKTMLRLATERDEIQVVDDQRGTPTWAQALARQVLQLISTELYGTYHATCQGSCTWYEFAQAIFKRANIQVRTVPVSSEALQQSARRPKNSTLDNYVLRLEGLDVMPSWEEALDRFFQEQDVVRQVNP